MSRFPHLRGLLAVVPAGLLLLACSATDSAAPVPGLVRSTASVGGTPGNGAADKNEVEVCKVGSTATIDVAVNGGAAQPQDFAAGECLVVNTSVVSPTPDAVALTETVLPANTVLDSIVVFQGLAPNRQTPLTLTKTVVTGSNTATALNGLELGALVIFYNRFVPPPPPSVDGRMTGGGKQTLVNGVSITRGFTIHCDIILSNNLEINWPGNKWHIDKPLTSARCFDDPNVAPAPPQAPFDTFVGEGLGELNGVAGSLVKFTFIDAGEPGTSDMAGIQIFDANNNLVLDVPLSLLGNGNIQAHYDQPHK